MIWFVMIKEKVRRTALFNLMISTYRSIANLVKFVFVMFVAVQLSTSSTCRVSGGLAVDVTVSVSVGIRDRIGVTRTVP